MADWMYLGYRSMFTLMNEERETLNRGGDKEKMSQCLKSVNSYSVYCNGRLIYSFTK